MPLCDAQKQLSGLILCEERSFGHYLKNALESAGYPAACVSNSTHDALTGFIRKRFDFAIISSALKQPCAGEVVRSIRAGETRAPSDLVIVLLQTGEIDDPAERVAYHSLGINAFVAWPASIDTLDHAVSEAISCHYRALDAIDSTHTCHSDGGDDPAPLIRYSGEIFSLPAGALVETMYLEDDIKIHDRVLIAAGTVLGEGHIRALESLQPVLENREVRVRFKRDA